MRKLAPVLMILLLLCSCARESKSGADAIRDHYRALESASYAVTQRTDFGDRVMDFKLIYKYSASSGDAFELLEPEALRGIKATLGGEGAKIEFEGMLLELGKLPGTGLSPLEALPFMVGQWREGYVTSEGKEKLDDIPCKRLTYKTAQGGVSVEHHAWFRESDCSPARAELFFDGTLTVSCEFEPSEASAG